MIPTLLLATALIRVSSTLPASCTKGDALFLTAPANQAGLYACTSRDQWRRTWRALTVDVDGAAAVGATDRLSVRAGEGIQIAGVLAVDGRVILTVTANTARLATLPVVQSGAPLLCIATMPAGGALACALSPTAQGRAYGMVVHLIAPGDVSGPATLNVDSTGAAPIRTADDAALSLRAGRMYLLWWDGSAWRMI